MHDMPARVLDALLDQLVRTVAHDQGRSQQFTQLVPTLIMALCYAASFFFLSLVLKSMPLGIAYAIWSGMGIVLIAVIGFAVFGQKLDLAAVIGLGLIVSGVVVVNLFSDSVSH